MLTTKTFYPYLLALLILILPAMSPLAQAADSTPDTINYQGRLLDSSNHALQGSYTFRFSIWTDADVQTGDITAGTLNCSLPRCVWNENQSTTTDAFGLFNINVGASTPIPDFVRSTHKYLQVEVKPSGSPNSSYEVLDPDGVDNASDRKPIQNQAFAKTADSLDNLIDANQTGDVVELIFGELLLNAIMSYDPDGVAVGDGRFNISDDVRIQGDLYVTGDILPLSSGNPVGLPIFVGTTTATTDGDISHGGKTGYAAANSMCDAEFSGSHICTPDDILTTIASQNIGTLFTGIVQGWVAEGAPGYTSNSNDCNGWTNNAATDYYGAYWVYDNSRGGDAWLSPCASVKPVSCCK